MNTGSPTATTATAAPVSFAAMIPRLLEGKKFRRQSWSGSDCIFMHADILHIRRADASLHTLLVSAGDLEATDWVVVRET